MARYILQSVCCTALLMGIAAVGYAADSPSNSSAPTSSASVPTPQTTLQEGLIAMLDLKAVPPTIQLKTADGKLWPLALDLLTTTVWQHGMPAKLDQLKVGDQVKVRYAEKNGKMMVKSIQLVQAPGTATPSSSSATTPTKSY